MSVENALISHVILRDALGDALSHNINGQFFHGQRSRKAWDWAYDYWTEYGQTPNETTFARQFPSYELEDTGEPLPALIDELRRSHIYTLTKDGLQEVVEKFDNPDEDAAPALARMQSLLAQVAIDGASADVESSSDFLEDFIEAVLEYDGMEIIGIPMGFPILDSHIGGLQDEQLVGIIAPPKHGKSTFALALAMKAESIGKRVGVISFEMSNREQKERYVSLGAGVSLTSIQRGLLTEREQERLLRFQIEQSKLRDAGHKGELILVHDIGSVLTCGGIAAKIEQLDLDMLVVDGVYMMQDEQGEKPGSPQALTNITRTFKRMCQKYKLPIVYTTQALLWKMSKGKGVQLDSAGYSSSFAQDSDVILGIDKDDLKRPESRFKLVAARNAIGLEVYVTVDLGRGMIKEDGIVADDGAASDVGYGQDFD